MPVAATFLQHDHDSVWLGRQARRTLDRLKPHLQPLFADQPQDSWAVFSHRLDQQFPRLFALLLRLYAGQYDFLWQLEEILKTAARAFIDRSAALHQLDAEHEQDPAWFTNNQHVGAVCYVDLFAGDLRGIESRIPYFQELGITYLHLMPLLEVPDGPNDGGYAVQSYRAVAPRLGSMAELERLAGKLRAAGIALVIDFVFNHTADTHEWARKAQAGDPDYQAFYHLFDDRTEPDAYQQHLRDIFPDRGGGAFTWREDIQKWVWTTFYPFQWDLRFANPAVFNAMAGEMLFLANRGIQVLRMDAVPFCWKEKGTNCENLPQAHWLLQAFNALVRIAAPALLFKSEAIVHPDDVIKYVSAEECQLSYNPMFMVLVWNSLATRDTRLMRHAMAKRFESPEGTAWVNYLRCHDDIGWGFADEDAQALWINGHDHRNFLNAYYTGRFPGSFARGLPFQENPQTGDCRISGMLASLAGLEKARHDNIPHDIDLAIRRILMMHGLILTLGGIPLLYLGDEVGCDNDYGFVAAPEKQADNRWVHRPPTDWPQQTRQRTTPGTPEQRIFDGLKHLIGLRKAHPAFSGADTRMVSLGNDHLFGFVRHDAGERLLVVASFSEWPQALPANELRLHGGGYSFVDLVSGTTLTAEQDVWLEPYQFLLVQA